METIFPWETRRKSILSLLISLWTIPSSASNAGMRMYTSQVFTPRSIHPQDKRLPQLSPSITPAYLKGPATETRFTYPTNP